MRSRQKIIRLQLDTDSNPDYLLLGIVTAEPDYKLSLAINRKLKISLRHKNPIEPGVHKDNGPHFSRFSDFSSATGIIFNLISNKSGKTVLLKKLDKIDYLLQVFSPDDNYDRDEIISLLRTIESITGVFPIDPGSIREKNLKYLIP